MDRTQIIKAVQVRIDDVVTDNAIEVVSNPIIDQMLDEQLRNAFKFLPVRFLPQKTITGTPALLQSGLYEITLASDYLRLVKFKTDVLNRPLYESDLVSEGTRDHVFMYHSYASGGNSRPRGCVTNLKLAFNSTATGTVENSFYVAIPTPEEVTTEILDPVAWYIASAVLLIIGEEKASQNAMSKVVEFITKNQ